MRKVWKQKFNTLNNATIKILQREFIPFLLKDENTISENHSIYSEKVKLVLKYINPNFSSKNNIKSIIDDLLYVLVSTFRNLQGEKEKEANNIF